MGGGRKGYPKLDMPTSSVVVEYDLLSGNTGLYLSAQQALVSSEGDSL